MSPIWRTSASVARRSGFHGKQPSLTNRGPGVADEERGDGQLQLVGEVLGEELRVHLAAALDHQPLHAARAEVPLTVRIATVSPPSTTVATGPRRERASATRGLAQ